MKKSKLPAAFLAFAITCLPGCFQKENPAGTEVENEVSGFLYQANGQPAVGAKVRIFPVDHNPLPAHSTEGPGVFAATTGPNGRYVLDSLPRGEYNILGELEGKYSYQDSVGVSSSQQTLPSDTLGVPGYLSGVVTVQPQDDPIAATVQVLGTNIFVNADSLGRFHLPAMAEGTYTVAASASLEDYTTLYASITVRSGQRDTLPDTLRIPFTGIPVVIGLRAAYDTLGGRVLLSWKPAHYSNLSEYVIYRSGSDAVVLNPEAVGRTPDTAFADTVFRGSSATDTGARNFDYRVRIRSKTTREGDPYGYVSVRTVPPARVRTVVNLEAAPGIKLTVNDSLRIIARFANDTRKNVRIRWMMNGDLARDASLPALPAGSDTLRLKTPASAGNIAFRALLTDDAGSQWEGKLSIEVVDDIPQLAISGPRSAGPGDLVQLSGSAPDLWHIVKWEWAIGAGAAFAEGGPQIRFAANFSGSDSILCILRATDEDGHIGLDSTVLNFEYWRDRGTILNYTRTMRFAVADGKFWAINTSATMEFDLAAHTWLWGGALGHQSINPPQILCSEAGKLYIIWSDEPFLLQLDATTGEWAKKNEVVPIRKAIGLDGKLFIFGLDNSFWEYFPESDLWARKTPPPAGSLRLGPELVAFNGKIYLDYGDVNSGTSDALGLIAYDPAADTWMKTEDFPWDAQPGVARLAPVGDRLLVIGRSKLTLEYDPAGNGWKVLAYSSPGEWVQEDTGEPPTTLNTPPEPVLMGGMPYLLGERLNGNFDRMERFNGSTNKWELLPSLMPLGLNSGYASDGKIYIVDAAKGNIYEFRLP